VHRPHYLETEFSNSWPIWSQSLDHEILFSVLRPNVSQLIYILKKELSIISLNSLRFNSTVMSDYLQHFLN